MTRRDALRRLAGAGLGIAAAGVHPALERAAEAQQDRPNILFILTDDHRWNALSCLGHPIIKTPNIDRIANEGANCMNAFVTTSLCSPSRASFLSGLYVHTHNVRGNEGDEIDPAIPTFPQVLQKSGYNTAFLGKWHMGPTSDPRPGFDYWLSFKGQGTYNDPELNENGREFKAKGYVTDLLTDATVKWLNQPRSKPFCLYLSHKAAHGPFEPPENMKHLYEGEELPEPPNFKDTFKGKPFWQRAEMVRGARVEQMEKNRNKPVPDELPPGKWNGKSWFIDYLRCLTAADASVGRVLETLEKNGQLDNTLIVFAGDNGMFMGDHRRGDKRLAYEESIRIPYLFRYPKAIKAGTRVEGMALNIDLAPTLLDFAGALAPAGIQGRSLRPLLEGRPTQWRKSFLYEYFQEHWLPGVPTMVGVRTERYKYVQYPELHDIDELYDLKTDPYEMTNLSQDAAQAGLLKEMRAELERLEKETRFTLKAPRKQMVRERHGSLVLHYDFTSTDQNVADKSDHGNTGHGVGGALVDFAGGKAWHFAGKTQVTVPHSPSLNPTNRPLTVTACVRADTDDGVILSHGGQSFGYALFVQDGVPAFAIRSSGALTVVRGTEKITGKDVHLAGMLSDHCEAQLYVDGKRVASQECDRYILTDPNEGITIGADTATKVGPYESDMGFQGVIADIRVYDGTRTPEEIAKEASERR